MFNVFHKLKTEELPTIDRVSRIINAYGAHLENNSGDIEEENRLPYPKRDIGIALLLGIQLLPEGDTQECLRGAFLRLASFQCLAKDEAQAVANFNNAMVMGSGGDSENAAKLIVDCKALHQKVHQSTMDEMRTLQAELDTVLRSKQLRKTILRSDTIGWIWLAVGYYIGVAMGVNLSQGGMTTIEMLIIPVSMWLGVYMFKQYTKDRK